MNLTFIKLDINILNDTKIKLIRKMPDGDSLLILWIGILCLAMKSGTPGMIEIGDGIPFTEEALSVELDIPVNTVRLGLSVFEKYKMIELWADGNTYIVNFNKHQEIDRIKDTAEKSRISSRKYREKLKLISMGQPSPSSARDLTRDDHVISRDIVGDCHVTKSDDTDKEEDIDKDKDKDIKSVSIETLSSPDASVDVAVAVKDPVQKCPQKEIVELWNRIMPELPHVLEWGDKSRSMLQARWRAKKEYQHMSWWEGFFVYIRGSDFLMGRKKEFRASLDWVVKPPNFEKIVNGNYENTGMASTGSRITDQNMRAAQEFLHG